jgi:hypothetical protein
MQFISRTHAKYRHGFSVPELMIGLALTSVMMVGAYRVMTISGQRTSEALSNAKDRTSTQSLLNRIHSQLTNVVTLVDSDAISATPVTSALFSYFPYACRTSLDRAISGIVPGPGFCGDDLLPNFLSDIIKDDLPLDPSSTQLITAANGSICHDSDAIRFIYMSGDSTPWALWMDANGQPFPTAQVEGTGDEVIALTTEGVTVNTKGTAICEAAEEKCDNDLVCYFQNQEFRSCVSAYANIGDFAILSDGLATDLIRITDMDFDGPNNRILIKHDANVSYWNRYLQRNYGTGTETVPFIQKVNLVTYYYRAVDKSIYMYNHMLDDNFDSTHRSFGGKNIVNDYRLHSVVQRNVNKFQVWYDIEGEQGQMMATRTPQQGTYGNEDSNCGNELGDPFLNGLTISIEDESGQKYEKTSRLHYAEQIAVNGEGGGASPFGDLTGSPVHLQ